MKRVRGRRTRTERMHSYTCRYTHIRVYTCRYTYIYKVRIYFGKLCSPFDKVGILNLEVWGKEAAPTPPHEPSSLPSQQLPLPPGASIAKETGTQPCTPAAPEPPKMKGLLFLAVTISLLLMLQVRADLQGKAHASCMGSQVPVLSGPPSTSKSGSRSLKTNPNSKSSTSDPTTPSP